MVVHQVRPSARGVQRAQEYGALRIAMILVSVIAIAAFVACASPAASPTAAPLATAKPTGAVSPVATVSPGGAATGAATKPAGSPPAVGTVAATKPAGATSPAPTVAADGGASQQVAAGMQVYTQSCQGCHGSNLEGRSGPPINNATLVRYQSADKILDYVSKNMPRNAPGSLTQQQYNDVIAFILDKLGALPAGQTISPETASRITFTR